MKINKINLCFFCFIIFILNGLEVFAQFESTKIPFSKSFAELEDTVLQKYLSTFVVNKNSKQFNLSLNDSRLKKGSISCSGNQIIFASVWAADSRINIDKYKEVNDSSKDISTKKWGVQTIPVYKIKELLCCRSDPKHGGIPTAIIPVFAYNDIFEPDTCKITKKWYSVKKYESSFQIYSNGEWIFLYLQGGTPENRYEVTWIIKCDPMDYSREEYIGRVIDKLPD